MNETSEIEREYAYKAKWKDILLITGFFGLLALGLYFPASKNMHMRGVSAQMLLILCVGFVVLAGFITVHKLSVRQRIAFTQTYLLVPKSPWSSQEKAIEYEAITKLYAFEVSGEQTLVITYPDGKIGIKAALLPSKAAFKEVCDLLNARVQISS